MKEKEEERKKTERKSGELRGWQSVLRQAVGSAFLTGAWREDDWAVAVAAGKLLPEHLPQAQQLAPDFPVACPLLTS